jgi:pyruvate/2-oxoglutarate dehydrogenase complex dihydrolipoamide dehydrogenase (E3) component
MKKYQIAVIGAGAAGLVVAIGAAMRGKKVLIIDKGPFGGDCTNFGCIPSKALIASAKAAFFIKTSKELGVHLNNSTFFSHFFCFKNVNEMQNSPDYLKLAFH